MGNKTALITGSSKRIGKSIALSLAKKGYNIAIHYNKSKIEAEKVVNEIKFLGVNAKSFKLNLEDINKVKFFFNSVTKYFNSVDLLINNASIFEYDSLKSSTIKSVDQHLNVNFKAPFFLIKFFVEQLGKKNGDVINIIDQRVLNITPYFTSYTISKSALYTLTKSLALSLAPKVKVNAIAPGPTLKSKRQTEKEFRNQIARTPLKNQVQLSEINKAIDLLINNKSITGQLISLDSGQNLGWAHTKSKKFIDD